jgi:hypothetical protein
LETEGELIRTIIIFFNFFKGDFLETSYYKNLMEYIQKINSVQKENINFFLSNLTQNTNKILKKEKKNNEQENENENEICENEENNDIEMNENDNEINEEQNIEICDIEMNENDNEINEEQNNDNEQINEISEIEKKNTKKKKRCVMTSGESLMLIQLIPFFFYEYINNNLNDSSIQILLIHFKLLSILMQKKFNSDDLNYIDFLVKQRIYYLINLGLKLVTKTFLQIHYSFYIRLTGPLRQTWCFPYENHHIQIKKDVVLSSNNIGITAFKNNFKFIIVSYELKLEKIISKDKDFIQYKKLRLDTLNFIDSNFCCEIEKNKKIGKIKKIFYLPSTSQIVFEIEIKKIEKDPIGIFFYIKKEKNIPITKIIQLKEIKVFFKIKKLDNKEFLINKIFVN